MVRVFAVFVSSLLLLSGCSFFSFSTKKEKSPVDDTEIRIQTYRDELRDSYDEFLREGKSILKK